MTARPNTALAALALALVASAPARAASLRLPEAGTPAVVVDTPDDWTPQRLNGITLNLLNAARDGVISMTVETVPADVDLNLFRDNLFRTAGCTSLNRAETVRIGGREAPAFYCQPGQPALAPARVVLVRLGPTHVLAISHSYRLDATGADVQGLEKVIGTARYEGLGR